VNVVLLGGGPRILRDQVIDACAAVHGAGGTVALISWLPVDEELAASLDGVSVVGGGSSRSAPAPSARSSNATSSNATSSSARSSSAASTKAPPVPTSARPGAAQVERVRAAVGWRVRRVKRKAKPYAAKVARRARFDSRPRQFAQAVKAPGPASAAIREADVVVAVDQAAVLAVWQSARRYPDAAALNGVPALLTHLTLDR
jgi:hypothetical protein